MFSFRIPAWVEKLLVYFNALKRFFRYLKKQYEIA